MFRGITGGTEAIREKAGCAVSVSLEDLLGGEDSGRVLPAGMDRLISDTPLAASSVDSLGLTFE